MAWRRRKGTDGGAMTLRPRAAFGLLAALVAATSLTGSFAESAPADPRVSVSSKVLDRAGAPLPNASLALSGFVRRNDSMIDLVVIGRATTDASGHFTISGDPSDLPSEENGAVSLELEVVDAPADQGFVYAFYAFPPAAGSVDWTVDLPSAPVFRVGRGLVENTSNLPVALRNGRVGGERSIAQETTEAGGTATLVAPPGEGGESDEETGNMTPRGVPDDYIVDGSGGTSCPEGYGPIGYLEQGVYKFNYVPTKLFRTRGRSRFTWEIGRSDETILEIAIDFDGVKYAGGSQYASKDERTLTHYATAYHNEQKIFKVKWRYERERKFCHEDLGLGHIWLLDVWRWLPDRAEAGNKFPDTTAHFDCGGTGPAYVDWLDQPVQVAKNTKVEYGGFFTIVGVTLHATQEDRTSQIFTINPNTNRPAKVCGFNDTPAYADLVKEMTY